MGLKHRSVACGMNICVFKKGLNRKDHTKPTDKQVASVGENFVCICERGHSQESCTTLQMPGGVSEDSVGMHLHMEVGSVRRQVWPAV